MSENALNGQETPARPIALLATVILCASMILFYFLFAQHFEKSRVWRLTIIITGTLSMSAATLIFTKNHDIMTTILSVGGVIGISALIRALHKNKLTFFKISGLVCIVLVGANNLFYFNENLEYLPLIQKLTFVLILAWTIGLNFKMKDKNVL